VPCAFGGPSGGWLLCEILPEIYPADQVASGNTRPWEVCGLFLKNAGRIHEAIAVFERLYMTMLDYEIQTGHHVMKGMPLVWISDCQNSLGRQIVARRFIMLTLVEDAGRLKRNDFSPEPRLLLPGSLDLRPPA